MIISVNNQRANIFDNTRHNIGSQCVLILNSQLKSSLHLVCDILSQPQKKLRSASSGKWDTRPEPEMCQSPHTIHPSPWTPLTPSFSILPADARIHFCLFKDCFIFQFGSISKLSSGFFTRLVVHPSSFLAFLSFICQQTEVTIQSINCFPLWCGQDFISLCFNTIKIYFKMLFKGYFFTYCCFKGKSNLCVRSMRCCWSHSSFRRQNSCYECAIKCIHSQDLRDKSSLLSLQH